MDDTMKDFGYVTSSEHETLSLFSRIPLTAWPLMEGFAISCIAVVVATLMARLSGGSANMSRVDSPCLVRARRFSF